MNKTRCVHCGKEFDNYVGYSLNRCIDCIEKDFVPEKSGISINCLICNEEVELTGEDVRYGVSVKVCDKCKEAVMKMRGDK